LSFFLGGDVYKGTLKQLWSAFCKAVQIMEEGVVADPRDADIGSILGWGFPIGLGGTISYIEMVGLSTFVAEADRLKQAYGSRFEPPRLLRDKAIRRESFYVPAGERAVTSSTSSPGQWVD
jgi:3-hydroxyacyl-CoA dehydrogenase/enoyl-CoA hydratase/3-hydroxybutyryl-CoA epimerase